MRPMRLSMGLLAVVLFGGPALAQESALKFGAWEVHHMHGFRGEDSSRASLLTDAGFIAVECRRPGAATLLVHWNPAVHIGSPDDYTPRDVSVRWDDGPPEDEAWEAFVGAAFKRDDAYARRFIEGLLTHDRLTLATTDAAGDPVESTFDLGPAEDRRAALEQVQRDCRDGWH